MRVLLFGATGMVGRGVLRECLLAADVEAVTAVVRRPTGVLDPKLAEVVHQDFADLSAVEDRLAGHDACFFCLGTSSAGMSEEAYRRVSLDFPMAAARVQARHGPGSVFVFLSGVGNEPSSRAMWARVKSRTVKELTALPLRVYDFQPALIQPLHGITSSTPAYRLFYMLGRPLLPLVRALFPRQVTTTESVGRAMLALARTRPEKRVVAMDDIHALAATPAPGRAPP